MKKYYVILSILGIFVFTHSASADTFTYVDTNGDARVDTIRWTSNGEYFTGCPASAFESGDWSINTAGTIGISAITGISCTGMDNILNIAVTALPGITGGSVNPVISYKNQGQTQIAGEGGYWGSMPSQTVTDAAAPRVLSATPANGFGYQNISVPIVVNFSEPMNTGSIVFSTSPSNSYSQSWSNNNQTLTLTHNPYGTSQNINATITSGKDANGVAMSGPYNWSFNTTGATSSNDNYSNNNRYNTGSGYNTSNSSFTNSWNMDFTPPTDTSISLIYPEWRQYQNKMVPVTPITKSRKITAELHATGASEMVVSTNQYLTDPWVPYSTFTGITLSEGNGTKTVYAKFRDKAGNISYPITATIILSGSTSASPHKGDKYSFTVNITKYSPKQTIKNMQEALNSDLSEDNIKPIPTDGVWGKSTTDAIKTFQSKHKLFVDGSAGWLTRVELSKVVIK